MRRVFTFNALSRNSMYLNEFYFDPLYYLIISVFSTILPTIVIVVTSFLHVMLLSTTDFSLLIK